MTPFEVRNGEGFAVVESKNASPSEFWPGTRIANSSLSVAASATGKERGTPVEKIRNFGLIDEDSGDGSPPDLVPAIVCPIPHYGVISDDLVEGLDEICVTEMEDVGADDEATTRRMPILASAWGDP
jgi:hypothetical protein